MFSIGYFNKFLINYLFYLVVYNKKPHLQRQDEYKILYVLIAFYNNYMCYVLSVSYTHLDVYKRQRQYDIHKETLLRV